MTSTTDALESFTMGLHHLRSFAERQRHTQIPHRHEEGYFSLGRWIEDVREQRERLSQRQTQEIESIRGWSWDSTAQRARADYVDNFDAGYLVLLEYVGERGNARVPQMENGQGSELGDWVHRRRVEYRAGRLTSAQIERLEVLHGWAWDAQDAKFQDAVERFRRYVDANGNGYVRRGYRDPQDGYSLGNWVAKQRDEQAANSLRQDRRAILDRLPMWTWS